MAAASWTAWAGIAAAALFGGGLRLLRPRSGRLDQGFAGGVLLALVFLDLVEALIRSSAVGQLGPSMVGAGTTVVLAALVLTPDVAATPDWWSRDGSGLALLAGVGTMTVTSVLAG